MKRIVLATVATAVLALPFAVRAEPGSDDHLQPKPWKRAQMTMQDKKADRMAEPRKATPLPSAFDAALNAQ